MACRAHAELAHGVGGLVDRLLRRVHRHHGCRRDAMGVRPEHVGVHLVDRARDGPAQLLVRIGDVEEAERGVEHREVDPEVVEPLVEELRDHRRRAIQGAGGLAPPRRAGGPAVEPLGRRHVVPAAVDVRRRHLPESLDDRRPGDLAEVVEEDRHRLEPVSVAVDHGMVELSTHRSGLRVSRVGHHILLGRYTRSCGIGESESSRAAQRSSHAAMSRPP